MIIVKTQEELDSLNINTIRRCKEIEIHNCNIPEGKFKDMPNLEKVVLNNVNIIGVGAFMGCKKLDYLEINKNKPKIIKDFAFYNTNIGIVPELYKNSIIGTYNNVGKNILFKNLSWSDIGKISELELAEKYFKIADSKPIIINNEIFDVLIYDFNHDDLTNNTNKAGITFGFKECLITPYKKYTADGCFIDMGYTANHEYTNIGGWGKSNIREYLNTDIYNSIPYDLKIQLKNIRKLSDIGGGNKNDLVETIDKLFLPSLEEVGYDENAPWGVYITHGQGKMYAIFKDYSYRKKCYNNGFSAKWWLRSTCNDTNSIFYGIYYDGSECSISANNINGISPCFCI